MATLDEWDLKAVVFFMHGGDSHHKYLLYLQSRKNECNSFGKELSLEPGDVEQKAH